MSTQHEIIEEFKKAFEKKTLNDLDPHLAEDMTYQVLPSSVGKKMNVADWKYYTNYIFNQIGEFKMEPTSFIDHPLLTVVQATVTILFPGGEFVQEVLLLFNFVKDESGALKISSVVEYVDSFKVKEWKAKMASYKKPAE